MNEIAETAPESNIALPDWFTWDHFRAAVDKHAQEEKKEWCGLPMPCKAAPLVIEPRSPYAHLTGLRLREGTEEPYCDEEPSCDDEDDEWEFVNSWYCLARAQAVYIVKHKETGKIRKFLWYHAEELRDRNTMFFKTLGTSRTLNACAELTAMEKLRGMIPEHLFDMYILQGQFLETSPRSGVTYVLRKNRPTVAIASGLGEESLRILSVLCLHPLGYYRGTWSGVMVPTDDVIAHLLMIRGDEHTFWKKANHHQTHQISAGL